MSPLELLILLLGEVFVYMAVGMVAGLIGLKLEHFRQILKRLVVWVLFPLLIFQNIMSKLSLDDAGAISTLLGLALVMVFTSTAIARLTLPWLTQKKENHGTLLLANTFHNYGYMVFPMVLAMLGPKALSLVFIFAVTCDGLIWSFGIYLLQRDTKLNYAEIISPPFVSVILSLALVFSGITLPATAVDILGYITMFAIPVALFSIGGVFYHSLRELERADVPWREVSGSLILRAVFFPMLWIGTAWALPIDLTLKRLFVIEGIMPASIGVVVLASLYGGKVPLAVASSGLSNVLAVVSIPMYWYIAEWVL